MHKSPAIKIDFLIVGQGLAGTVLAWELSKRGLGFQIIDRGDAQTSSKVAAGLINPITGKFLTKSWRADETLPHAWDFYRQLEQKLQASFIHDLPIVRLFKSDDEVARWKKRKADPAYRDYFLDDDRLIDSPAVDSSFGGFVARHSGYLDVADFLERSRQAFEEMDCFAETEDWEQFQDKAKTIVFCQGYLAASNPLFDWVPFKSAKGEVLDLVIDAPELPRDRIYNRGTWLLPTADGLLRSGSTFSWNPLDEAPTQAGREQIESRLRQWLRVPFEVVGQRAAVRPIVEAGKVLMGRHPARDEIAFFNGLGSKGVSHAPYFASQLVDHLCGKGTIDAEVDLRKNL